MIFGGGIQVFAQPHATFVDSRDAQHGTLLLVIHFKAHHLPHKNGPCSFEIAHIGDTNDGKLTGPQHHVTFAHLPGYDDELRLTDGEESGTVAERVVRHNLTEEEIAVTVGRHQIHHDGRNANCKDGKVFFANAGRTEDLSAESIAGLWQVTRDAESEFFLSAGKSHDEGQIVGRGPGAAMVVDAEVAVVRHGAGERPGLTFGGLIDIKIFFIAQA